MEGCLFFAGTFVGATVIAVLAALWVVRLPKIQRDALLRWPRQSRQPPHASAPEVIDVSHWGGVDYARRKKMSQPFPDGSNQ